MRETVFRKMPQQYLVVGSFFLILGAWIRHLAQAGGATSPDADFFHASHGTLMVFFGIIPIFFVAAGFGLVPLVETIAWPFLDRFALIVFYLSAVVVVITLRARSHALLNVAMGLNFLFGIAAAVGFMVRSSLTRKYRGIGRVHATAIAFLGLSLWIIFAYALLEFAAIMQLTGAWISGDGPIYYVASPNEVAVPLVWKHFFWFLGHPEVLVFLALFGGLAVDGLRNLLGWRALGFSRRRS